MVKKTKLKNKKKLLFLIAFLFIILCFLLFHIKSYSITYKVEDIEVTETYDKKNQLYQFLFKKEGKEYIVQYAKKAIHKKKLIYQIETKEDENTICLIPKSKKIDFYPLCYQNEEAINYHLINNKDLLPNEYFKKIETEPKEYNNIKINFLNNKKYYIWNYKGFYIIDEKKQENLKLLEKDTYNIPLVYKTENHILLADYNENYKFNRFYAILEKTNKVKEITTNKELSFDSYMMGNLQEKVYFFDKKNKKEYEINLKKYSIEEITTHNKGKIINNGTWEEMSTNKLSAEEYHFSTYHPFHYEILEEKLYLVINDSKIRVSNLNPKEIIDIKGDTVYYLVDDKLYYFNPTDGEILILSYFEWNFNYKGMIYIF